MARIPRVVVPAHPHHVWQRGVRRSTVFANDNHRQKYVMLLSEQCRKHGVDVLAWCLMDNHLHLVLVPPVAEALARCVGEAHRRFTCHRNEAEGVTGYLFQGRFGSCPLDERHLRASVRYIEMNPVTAGLVDNPEQWLWSSAGFHLGVRAEDPLVSGGELFPNWAEVLVDSDPVALGRLEQCMRTGRPAGDRRFLVRAERLTGRRLRPRKRGRPRKA